MLYLMNTWYAAARSEEVTLGVLLARTLLETPVVLFRDPDGRAHALLDRCPHRFAPLSMGRLRDDGVLLCRYHGLGFDAAGACVLNPHGEGRIPPAAQARAFPLEERYGYLWIWPGEAERADSSLLPDLLSAPGPGAKGAVRGYLRTEADYQLVTDNLMDLSHVGFLHGGGLGDASFGKASLKIVREDGAIHQKLWVPDEPPAPFYAAGLPDPTAHVDHWMEMRWSAPAVMLLDVGITPTGAPRSAGGGGFAAHLVTPETPETSHYFWTIWRTYDLDNEEATSRAAAGALYAFTQEDKPMIEAQQRRMAGADFWAMEPILLPTDAAAVQVRRTLSSRIAQEAEASQDSAAAWALTS